jgi:hypothetical protein
LPFLVRRERRERGYKRIITCATLLTVVVLVLAVPAGRYHLLLLGSRARAELARRLVGLAPDRAQIEAEWSLRRQRSTEETKKRLTSFYEGTTEEMRALFRTAGMDPEHGLIRYGRGDQTFLISPQVFEPDAHGRSYRLRPSTRSVWLRQITLRNGPFGLFQVLDTPAHREAAARAGGIVDLGSIQNTNSWGLRGPEPDPSAPVRGVVLGDSFMQAMFNGDRDTPPLLLEKYLESAWNVRVSILNTGHIGYSPEQYYYTLREYGERMRPQFVVVSVCPNDFGDGFDVLRGRGDWFAEAEYWLDQIQMWCRGRDTTCILVPVPTHIQLESTRNDAAYPGQVSAIFHAQAARYCDPLNDFVDEHLRLAALQLKAGRSPGSSRLFNREISDDHFSPQGAALWAEVVGRRLVRVLDPAWAGSPLQKLQGKGARNAAVGQDPDASQHARQ